MELYSSVQSSSQNEKIVNTSKKLLKLDTELFPYCAPNHAGFCMECYTELKWVKENINYLKF